MPGFRPALAGCLVAWTMAQLAGRALARVSESAPWSRTNYRGRTVSLTGGIAVASGALAGATAAAALAGGPVGPIAVLAAGGSAAAAGGYDDLFAPARDSRADKGWRGHLRALRAGRISGGAVKVLAIGAGALVAAGRIEPQAAHRPGRVAERVVSAALVAGTANLINLFDLRPGRAGKIAVATAMTLSGGPSGAIAAATGAAALAGLPADLDEMRMLGDLGANPLGALLGLRLAAARAPVRAVALAGVVALTAASERVSFSRVIDSSPVLRRLDGWGRRPDDPVPGLVPGLVPMRVPIRVSVAPPDGS